jgi:hypothetical protein
VKVVRMRFLPFDGAASLLQEGSAERTRRRERRRVSMVVII